jgi:hypothetical protein
MRQPRVASAVIKLKLDVTVSPLQQMALSEHTPLGGEGGGGSGRMRERFSGVITLCIAALAVLAVLFLCTNSPRGLKIALLSDAAPERKIGRRAVYLSTAHQQLLQLAPTQRKAVLQKLAGCDCMDVDGLTDTTWGHYTPKCCSAAKEKTSLKSVMDSYIKAALANSKTLGDALASAKAKLDKKLSVIIDAVTMKAAGVPGPPGPQGPKGPTGYVGAPGPQVLLGHVLSIFIWNERFFARVLVDLLV